MGFPVKNNGAIDSMNEGRESRYIGKMLSAAGQGRVIQRV
jgi:hypothetical protein